MWPAEQLQVDPSPPVQEGPFFTGAVVANDDKPASRPMKQSFRIRRFMEILLPKTLGLAWFQTALFDYLHSHGTKEFLDPRVTLYHGMSAPVQQLLTYACKFLPILVPSCFRKLLEASGRTFDRRNISNDNREKIGMFLNLSILQ
jgi:hypothetical protein